MLTLPKQTAKLIKGASFLFLKNIVASMSTLVVAYIAANYLEQNTYGTYKYILSVAALAIVFSLTGANESLLRATAKGKKVLFALFKKKLIYSAGTFLVLIGVAAYYSYQENFILGTSFFIAAFLQPLLQSFKLYGGYLNGLQRYGNIALYGTTTSVVTALVMGTVMFLYNEPIILILAYFTIHTLVHGLFFWLILQKGEFKNKSYTNDNLQESQTEIVYAQHLSLMNIISQVANQLDKIIAFQLFGAAALAQYTFAKVPVDTIKGQNKILRSLLAPRFSKYTATNILRNVHKKALLYFVTVLALTITYWLAAPYLFNIFFSNYTDMIFNSQILALGLLTMPAVFYGEFLISQKKIRELYIIKTIVPSVRILLLLSLTHFFGFLGLVLSFIIPRYLHLFLNIYLAYRVHK